MSASLAKQFEDCAARCLELARAAKTAGRARFMQIAREYQSAAALIPQERSDLASTTTTAGTPCHHPMISTDGTKPRLHPGPQGAAIGAQATAITVAPSASVLRLGAVDQR